MNSMKLLQNVPAITKAIIIAGMLGACQNEKDVAVSPIAEQANEANYQNAKISADSKLISDGKVKLEYSGPRNLLAKEINEGKKYYIKYTHSDQTIKAVKYHLLSNTYISTTTYKLDSKGKCIESHYTAPNMTNKVTIHEYNADGQLSKSYDKNSTDERQEFTYSWAPEGVTKALSYVTFYNATNKKYKELSYSYWKEKEDFYPLNPGYIANETGKYLPIFGSFGSHLPKYIGEITYKVTHPYTSTGNVGRYYDFTHYANGTVKTIEEKTGNTIVTTERKYASAMVAN